MKSLVVFFALASVACGSIIPWAQPAHHAAVVLDPHGRPLDTADVINARAIHLQAKALEGHGALAVAPIVHSVVAAPALVAAPAVVAAPAAVSHQSRVDVRTSPAIVTAHAAPVLAAHGVYGAPLLGHSALGLAGHGHLLKKRSLGHIAYAAPVLAHAAPVYAAAPAAVSHQSRVDVVSSPAVVSHAVAAPVLAHAAVAPVVAHAVAPAAVSHQSRVDVRTSPAIAVAAVAPFAHGVVSAPLAHGYLSAPLAHSGLLHSAHSW
ncbi:cuticle protein 16.5 [Battus philenor]|uniref:cuticle protein 16.5 n=1 Tax=Battus philenor TaxID=42288 RepID=UPI0035CF7ECC